MTRSEPIPFFKMNGIGNRILFADMRGRADKIAPQAASALADSPLAAAPETRFDQLMVLYETDAPHIEGAIDIFNSDGSEAEACGNGMRCLAWRVSADTGRKRLAFRTKAGLIKTETHTDDSVSVNMGEPLFDWRQIPLAEEFADTKAIELQIGPIDAPVLHSPSAVNIGNPHAVFWVEKDPDCFELEKFGPLLENHPIFPDRANITLARVEDRENLKIRTWERGAGLTLACGSAACASAVCAARTGRTERQVRVRLPGGELRVEWQKDNTILMRGPAQCEFSGRFDLETGEWTRNE